MFSKLQKPSAIKQARISWSIEAARIVQEAKVAIQEAKPDKALKCLFDLKNPELEEELSLHSNQLAYIKRDDIRGVISTEEKGIAFRRVGQNLLRLISEIETILAASQGINQQLRNYLNLRYEQRLKHKLAERQPVNLRHLVSTEGTSDFTSAIFVAYSANEINDGIGQVFKDAHGRLLIVGDPGSGKSTLLLQLAQNLLDTEKDALPVVLNLATWKSSFADLRDWLLQILPTELSINKSATDLILQQSGLILLLDGLDEVRPEERSTCLKAIGNFGTGPEERFAISSRIMEYREVLQDAPVNLQIEIGALTVDQLERQLLETGYKQPEALPLLQALRQDELLRQVVQTPFYLNTLQVLFASRKTLNDLQFTTETIEGRQMEIKNQFIKQELEIGSLLNYSPEKSKHWLCFFAYQMNRNNKVIYELADLQYSWGNWSFIEIMMAWLIFAIVMGVTAGLILGLTMGIGFGILTAIVTGTFKATLAVSIFAFKLGILGGIVLLPMGVLSLGLLAKLASGSAGKIISTLVKHIFSGGGKWWNAGMEKGMPDIKTVDKVRWSFNRVIHDALKRKELMNSLFIGSLFVLYVEGLKLHIGLFREALVFIFPWLIFSPIGSLFKMITESDVFFIQINTPYQRFNASMKSMYFSILQHFFLRFQFHRKGLLPLHLVDFLNEMSARHLLETDGASWRFRHKLIQDWFADEWVKMHASEA